MVRLAHAIERSRVDDCSPVVDIYTYAKMARRRSSTTICDSFLCTAAVATPLVFSLAYYRNDLRQLLRIFFLGIVLFGALLTLRHSLRRALLRLNGWLSRGKKEEEEGERSRVYAPLSPLYYRAYSQYKVPIYY